MSTAARKARKRAGTPFTRTPKVGTPAHERAEFQPHEVANPTLAIFRRRFGLSRNTDRKLARYLLAAATRTTSEGAKK